jgi:hypothetical protein
MTSLTLYIFIEVPSAADKMESHGVNILDSIKEKLHTLGTILKYKMKT